MTRTPNPPAFEAAVREHLRGTEEQFNHQQMLLTFLDNDRFHRWAQVIDRYRPLAGARVLASGCGFGGSLLAYHDAGAARVAGVEIDPEYVRFSTLRVAGLDTAEVLPTDGGRLPFDDGAFDVIESMDVIEHTDDDRAYLAELTRLLAPGGLLLLVTPNRLWPVEQHFQFVGPPWLPIGLGNRLFAALARLPGLSEDRRLRYSRLHTTRTQNMSLRRLRALARDLDLHLRVIPPWEHEPHWPLPREGARLERLAAHRLGALVAPVKTLAVTLEHRDAPALPSGG
jgi:SAM-dependent methyltransferase